MKLYLTSSLSKDHEKSFFESISNEKGIAVILVTASKEHKAENWHIKNTKTNLLNLGYEVLLLDIDIDSPKVIIECDLLYIAGGSPHYLLKRVNETGTIEYIKQAVSKNIPTIASSAGAVILGNSSYIVDVLDPKLNDENTSDRTGLALIDYVVLPHSNRWEAKLSDLNAKLEKVEKHTRSKTLKVPDGTVLRFYSRSHFEELSA